MSEPTLDELAAAADELGEARTNLLNAADRLAAYLASPARVADHNDHVAMAGAGTILPHGILTEKDLAVLRQTATDLGIARQRLTNRIDRIAARPPTPGDTSS